MGMNKLTWHEFSTNVLAGAEHIPAFCTELLQRQAMCGRRKS